MISTVRSELKLIRAKKGSVTPHIANAIEAMHEAQKSDFYQLSAMMDGKIRKYNLMVIAMVLSTALFNSVLLYVKI